MDPEAPPDPEISPKTENNETPTSCISNNVNVNEIDNETNTKLRGDAIGDTLYSQSFVLKTLLQFSDLKWSKETEEDFCFLWDMTVEKEVCKYLFELSFPSLASSAVLKYNESRFIEIVVGILANIIVAYPEGNVSEEETEIVLGELDTDDSLILIQIVRFIIALDFKYKKASFLTETALEKLDFILCNSTKRELLLKTLEAFAKLTEDFKLDHKLVKGLLVNNTLIAYQTITNEGNNSELYFLETKENQLAVRYLIEIVFNICRYVDRYESDELLKEAKQYCNIFVNELIKIIKYFLIEDHLLPISELTEFYLSAFVVIIRILNVNYMTDLFIVIFKLFLLVMKFKKSNSFETCSEMLCYFLYKGNRYKILADLDNLPRTNVVRVLNVVKKSKIKYDFAFMENVMFISSEINHK